MGAVEFRLTACHPKSQGLVTVAFASRKHLADRRHSTGVVSLLRLPVTSVNVWSVYTLPNFRGFLTAMSAQRVLEILQLEYRCELTGLPHNGQQLPDVNIPPEKLHQIKESIFGDDPEAEEFTMMYLESLQMCKFELEQMDAMTDEACTNYLEVLKMGTQTMWAQDPSKILSGGKRKTGTDGGGYAVPKKRRGNLPKSATNILKKWLFDHLFHPVSPHPNQ